MTLNKSHVAKLSISNEAKVVEDQKRSING